jgi:hypothetical protein
MMNERRVPITAGGQYEVFMDREIPFTDWSSWLKPGNDAGLPAIIKENDFARADRMYLVAGSQTVWGENHSSRWAGLLASSITHEGHPCNARMGRTPRCVSSNRTLPRLPTRASTIVGFLGIHGNTVHP